MRRWLIGVMGGAALLLGAAAVPAQPAVDVPAALAPWTAWVLEGHEHRRCPFVLGQAPGGAGHQRSSSAGATLPVQTASTKPVLAAKCLRSKV